MSNSASSYYTDDKSLCFCLPISPTVAHCFQWQTFAVSILTQGAPLINITYIHISQNVLRNLWLKCVLHSWSMHNQLHLYLEKYKLIVLYQIFLGTWPPKCTCSCSDRHEWSDPHNISYNCYLSTLPKRTYNVMPNTFLCNHSNILCCRQVQEQNQKQSVNPGQAGEMSPNTSKQVRQAFSKFVNFCIAF